MNWLKRLFYRPLDLSQVKLENVPSILIIYGKTRQEAYQTAYDLCVKARVKFDIPDGTPVIGLAEGERLEQMTDIQLAKIGLKKMRPSSLT